MSDPTIAMSDMLRLLQRRHCTRAFLPKLVPNTIIAAVIDAATNAPSSQNMQPWQVTVLSGSACIALADLLVSAHNAKVPTKRDYKNRPHPANIPLELQRNIAIYGESYYSSQGYDRHDATARNCSRIRNLQFFGAPVELIVHCAAKSVEGTFLDIGMFIENLILGFLSFGVGCCPQGAVAGMAPIVKKYLGMGDDRIIVLGLALGYPDLSAPVNSYHPPRVPLQSIATFIGDDDVVRDDEDSGGAPRLVRPGYIPLTFPKATATNSQL